MISALLDCQESLDKRVSLLGVLATWQSASQNLTILSELPIKSEDLGERIATPSCGMVRNDSFFDTLMSGDRVISVPFLHPAENGENGLKEYCLLHFFFAEATIKR